MAGLGQLIGLIGLIAFVSTLAFIGYQVYLWTNELAERGRAGMDKRNIGFTKEGGLRVGVKDIGQEAYVDKTQNVLINTWNNASQSNLNSASPRPGNSRHGSSTTGASTPKDGGRTGRSTAANLPVPEQRSTRRSASPVPGAFD